MRPGLRPVRQVGGVLLGVLLLLLGACGGGEQGETTLRVFAAASLTETFTGIAEEFEADHPGVTVELNFGPSSGLAEQIRGGAPADVYAAASPDPMERLTGDGVANEPRNFATNRLAIAVPEDNPGDVRGLEDLAGEGIKVALCQPQVPCGEVAAAVLDGAGLDVRPATEEVDVKGVLTKVDLGEVDAGLVYVTDVRAADNEDRAEGRRRVRAVDIPAEQNRSTTYPIATLTDADRGPLAQELVDLVLSPTGARILADAGFGPP